MFRRVTALITVAAIPILAACDDSPTSPEVNAEPQMAVGSQPQLNNEVVFEGPDGIYVVDPDGRNLRFLAEGSEPDVSPNGKQIVFERSEDIYVMDADGANQIRLTGAGDYVRGDRPKWSPDGSLIVFQADGYETGLIEPNGANLRIVDAFYRFLRWSTDGSSFYSSNSGHVNEVSLDGGIRVLEVPGAYPSDISPDGTRVIFRRSRSVDGVANARMELWSKTIADGTEAKLAGGRVHESMSWSPDGTEIAFVRDGGVWLMSSNGCDKRRIHLPALSDGTDGGFGGVSWSRSGGRILFSFDDRLWSVKTDGSRVWSLGPLKAHLPDWSQRQSAAPSGLPAAVPTCVAG